MKRSTFFLIIVSLFYSSLYAGDPERIGTNFLNLFPHGFVEEQLNGFGLRQSTNTTLANIGSGNPAVLSDFDQVSLGGSYQLSSRIEDAWSYGVDYKQNYTFWPQSFGVVYPLKNFRFAYGLGQKYNAIMDYGPLEVSTVEMPEGTGEFFDAYNEFLILSNSAILSYMINNLISKNDRLNLGIQYNVDHLSYKSKLWRNVATADGFASSFSAGIRYDVDLDLPAFQIGIFFENGIEFRGEAKLKNSESLIEVDPNPPGNNDSLIIADIPTWSFQTRLPDKLSFGFFMQPIQKIGIAFNFTSVRWNKVSDNWDNSIDLSSTAILYPHKNLAFSLGYYQSQRKYNQETNAIFKIGSKADAFFITTGVVINTGNFIIDIALADSHLFSGDWRKQTISKVEIGYNF